MKYNGFRLLSGVLAKNNLSFLHYFEFLSYLALAYLIFYENKNYKIICIGLYCGDFMLVYP